MIESSYRCCYSHLPLFQPKICSATFILPVTLPSRCFLLESMSLSLRPQADKEGLWKKKYSGLGITEDQAKIEEYSMILTTKVLNEEVKKIGDLGKTADLLEKLYDPADILPMQNNDVARKGVFYNRNFVF